MIHASTNTPARFAVLPRPAYPAASRSALPARL